jgi:CMP-N,N'-diacetyllegionaminic acid synthase
VAEARNGAMDRNCGLKTDVIAIVPARSGSKGVRDKNVISVAGFPLLAYSIAVGHLSNRVNRLILSTDSEEYADVGRRFGAEVPFLRPPELSGDTSTDRDFMLHAMDWIRANENAVPEYWVHLRPTTPLRQPETVDEAVLRLAQDPDATSLRSAHLASESPFKWFRRDEAGYLMGLTDDDHMLDSQNRPRQGFPDVYIPDGYVDVVRASYVTQTEFLHGDRVIGYESPPCVEVDTEEEIKLLEFQLSRTPSPLLEYLQSNYSETG